MDVIVILPLRRFEQSPFAFGISINNQVQDIRLYAKRFKSVANFRLVSGLNNLNQKRCLGQHKIQLGGYLAILLNPLTLFNEIV
jgi:hypothetical protein